MHMDKKYPVLATQCIYYCNFRNLELNVSSGSITKESHRTGELAHLGISWHTWQGDLAPFEHVEVQIDGFACDNGIYI